MSSLRSQFSKYNQQVQKTVSQYSAKLGKTPTIIEHPTRNGFCYARMADNLNELITVFNDKVSQAYDLPILVERRGNIWYVVGRDIQRYTDWETQAPFLPKHAAQHSFDRDNNTGADAVFIYPDQFTPLLVYPSGSIGAGNLQVAPYLFKRDTDFVYAGNTGTQNLLIYKPIDNQAIMGLVYLDRTTGNPGFLVASGTPMPGTYTGTSQITPYLPFPSSNQEPLYFVRLVSGTSTLLWGNLYNARQFIGGGISGLADAPSDGFVYGRKDTLWVNITGSGGTGIPGGSDSQVQYNCSGTFGGMNGATWDNVNNSLTLGGLKETTDPNSDLLNLVAKTDGISTRLRSFAYGTDISNFWYGVRSRGTRAARTALTALNSIMVMAGLGHDGAGWTGILAEFRIKTTEALTSIAHGTGLFWYGTPRGSTTLTEFGSLDETGFNLPTGTYNIGGIPHTHNIREKLSATRTYYVRTDGNDTNTGLVDSSGGAFLTIQKAIDTVSVLDINGYTVTLQIGDGTYAEVVTLKNVVGFSAAGNLVIQGNNGTPANVLVNTTGSCFVSNGLSSIWDIKDLKVQATIIGLYAQNGAKIRFGNLVFGACTSAHMRTESAANITVLSNYAISGSAPYHMLALFGSTIVVNNVTITLSGTPRFSSGFAGSQYVSFIQGNGNTYAGAATGTRYNVIMNGVINTSGGGFNYFPGQSTITGTVNTGGQYA